MSKKNIMRRFKIEEISGVDRPAQKEAKALIMKRDSSEDDPLAKNMKAALTTEFEGHTHLVPLVYPYPYIENEGEIELERSGMTLYGHGHDHPWVLLENGDIVIGMANGHTHNIDVIGKQDTGLLPEKGSTDSLNQSADNDEVTNMGKHNEAEGSKPTVEELQKELNKALKVAEMTDGQKAHYATLDGDVAENFLQKSAEDKEAELAAIKKAASDTDPVVYTTADGHQLRKSAGEVLISLAKSADAAKKENAELKKAQRQGELKKRAEDELQHLPGTVEVRAALLEAVDGITCEETRKAAGELLKSHNESLSGAYHTYGVEGSQKDESAEKQLETMAKAYAKEHKVTEAAAYAAVTTTPEGSALYAKAVG